jgi:YkoY family integral membrane protein
MNLSTIVLHGAGTVTILGLLEAVLSADNAVAIAALVRDLEPQALRQRALNWGLVMAFVLRALMITLAAWVVRFPQIQVLGGLYLVWLSLRYFQNQLNPEEDQTTTPQRKEHSLLQIVALVALTDLAFSLDSVMAAVAFTNRIPLVILGGAMGLLMLRFLTRWVLIWMERYVNLQNAAYLTVLAVGLRLVASVMTPALAPPEPMVLVMMAAFFLWGFSRRVEVCELDQAPAVAVSSGIGVWMTPKCTSANTTSV